MRNTSKSYKWLRWIIFIVILVGIQVNNASAQISVIVGKDVTKEISADDLKAFFSGEKFKYSDGSPVQIVDQPKRTISKDFYKKLLDMSKTKLAQRWMKLVLSGQAKAPVKCESDEEVKKAIAENSDYIGYIMTSSLDETVREVLKLE